MQIILNLPDNLSQTDTLPLPSPILPLYHVRLYRLRLVSWGRKNAFSLNKLYTTDASGHDINRSLKNLDELEEVVFERCQVLLKQPSLIKAIACFHW